MRTMHPVLKRGGLFWDRELLPVRTYEERFARIQSAIAASGDDAWLIFGDVERYGGLAWFSNFLPRTRSAIALVPRSGAPTLLISVGLRDVPAAKTLTWIDDVRPFSRLPRSLVDLIRERQFASSRLGIAGVEEMLAIKDWSEIESALPEVTWAARTDDVALMRARKDDSEFSALRRVAGAVSEGLDLCAGLLRPGVDIRVALSRVERTIRKSAAEDVRILQASGPQTGVALRPLANRTLRQGDTVMLYIAAAVQRYWAEEARTFVLGEASPKLRDLAKRGAAALDAMAQLTGEGVESDLLARAAGNALGDGVADESAKAYGYGSGVGLDAAEFPVICIGSRQRTPTRGALALRVIAHEDGAGLALAQTIQCVDGNVQRHGSPGLFELPC